MRPETYSRQGTPQCGTCLRSASAPYNAPHVGQGRSTGLRPALATRFALRRFAASLCSASSGTVLKSQCLLYRMVLPLERNVARRRVVRRVVAIDLCEATERLWGATSGTLPLPHRDSVGGQTQASLLASCRARRRMQCNDLGTYTASSVPGANPAFRSQLGGCSFNTIGHDCDAAFSVFHRCQIIAVFPVENA
jgi:hypothetical protein